MKQKSKPLVILSSHPEIETIFLEMENEVDPLATEGAQLMDKLKELKSKVSEIQGKHWKEIENKLLRDGLIDSRDLSLSVRDGVLYMDPKDLRDGISELLSRLFE